MPTRFALKQPATDVAETDRVETFRHAGIQHGSRRVRYPHSPVARSYAIRELRFTRCWFCARIQPSTADGDLPFAARGPRNRRPPRTGRQGRRRGGATRRTVPERETPIALNTGKPLVRSRYADPTRFGVPTVSIASASARAASIERCRRTIAVRTARNVMSTLHVMRATGSSRRKPRVIPGCGLGTTQVDRHVPCRLCLPRPQGSLARSVIRTRTCDGQPASQGQQ